MCVCLHPEQDYLRLLPRAGSLIWPFTHPDSEPIRYCQPLSSSGSRRKEDSLASFAIVRRLYPYGVLAVEAEMGAGIRGSPAADLP